jgi:hypothetical protein
MASSSSLKRSQSPTNATIDATTLDAAAPVPKKIKTSHATVQENSKVEFATTLDSAKGETAPQQASRDEKEPLSQLDEKKPILQLLLWNTHHFSKSSPFALLTYLASGGLESVKFCSEPDLETSDWPTYYQRLFSFFGVVGSLKVPNLSKAESVIAQVFRDLDTLAFPSDVRLVRVGTCGCNMGNCSTPTDVTLLDQPKTYGEALRGVCEPDECGIAAGATFEYPDSVWFFVKPFVAPKMLGHYGYGNDKPIPYVPTFTLDPNCRYFETSFSR